MIQVKNLTKYFGPTLAVDNISFHIAKGEIVGFLGPNGAGKTTTIRILTTYIPASSGSARVGDHDVFTDSLAVRRMVGYLPESTPLYPEMRVREYLDFRGKLRAMSRDVRAKAIGRVAERCWLNDFINRPIGQLSKGMKQRVGLADALLHNPPVLILDEPTIGLDPAQIRETRRLIKELATQHTVILCTHILPEVEMVCHRTIIIANGRIVASGSPDELRESVTGRSRLIAELRGSKDEITAAIGKLDGVQHVDCELIDGWNRLAIKTADGTDLREAIVSLAGERKWPLREIKREVGSLEEYFVQITAQQVQRRRM
ncbi:MAG: ABC transporter ATP-binding protein [Phycisphaerales bacterium]|nr:MAG: ABC transporter ATP-binding protein [Phycisphaerales bacterium]